EIDARQKPRTGGADHAKIGQRATGRPDTDAESLAIDHAAQHVGDVTTAEKGDTARETRRAGRGDRAKVGDGAGGVLYSNSCIEAADRCAGCIGAAVGDLATRAKINAVAGAGRNRAKIVDRRERADGGVDLHAVIVALRTSAPLVIVPVAAFVTLPPPTR